MEFWGDFEGRGEDIWWESTSVLSTAHFQTSLVHRVKEFNMGIAICHRRKFGQVWGSQLRYQKSQENFAA